jgi:chemotaxis signal transduction protein
MGKEDIMQRLVFVRYVDHVFYNRSSAIAMQPQVREAVGWLVYECDRYVTISWDRDAEPPTLRGGDPKASGLVLLKADIISLVRLTSELILKSKDDKQEGEYAFRPSERKTHRPKKGKTAT